jgi:hypothetical protein
MLGRWGKKGYVLLTRSRKRLVGVEALGNDFMIVMAPFR